MSSRLCRACGDWHDLDEPWPIECSAPAPAGRSDRFVFNYWPDIPEYRSPVTGDLIDGRVARREDLKRHDCIEVDPPKSRAMRTERWANRTGLPLKGRDI